MIIRAVDNIVNTVHNIVNTVHNIVNTIYYEKNEMLGCKIFEISRSDLQSHFQKYQKYTVINRSIDPNTMRNIYNFINGNNDNKDYFLINGKVYHKFYIIKSEKLEYIEIIFESKDYGVEPFHPDFLLLIKVLHGEIYKPFKENVYKQICLENYKNKEHHTSLFRKIWSI